MQSVVENFLKSLGFDKKITLSCAFIAIIAFFLPWVRVSCDSNGSSMEIFTATGLDLTKGFSIPFNEGMKNRIQGTKEGKSSKTEGDLIYILCLVVPIGIVAGIFYIKKNKNYKLFANIAIVAILIVFGITVYKIYNIYDESRPKASSDMRENDLEKALTDVIKVRLQVGIWLTYITYIGMIYGLSTGKKTLQAKTSHSRSS